VLPTTKSGCKLLIQESALGMSRVLDEAQGFTSTMGVSDWQIWKSIEMCIEVL